MIRDRLRKAARKVAIKAFGMEWETEDYERNVKRPKEAPAKIDESVIPAIFTGADDTPGPNHKTLIGRPFAAAQLAANGCFLDVRAPADLAAGGIPTAHAMPGMRIQQHLDVLPADRDLRVVVYDQTGSEHSDAVATWLRNNGWPWARKLQGGFAEWLQHGEPIAPAEPPEGGTHRPGDRVTLDDGRKGYVIEAGRDASGPTYMLWLDEEEAIGPVGGDAFAS